MYLVFDTETSNIPSDKISLYDENQSYLMQIAMCLLDDKFEKQFSFSSYIKVPSTIKVSEGAFKAHGLTTQKVNKFGIDPQPALIIYNELLKQSQVVIGYNTPFDLGVLDLEFGRIGIRVRENFPFLCMMRTMTDICKLPGKFPGKYKWPKLSEAYKYCFGRELEGAHDAMEDVIATCEIFHWFKKYQPVNIPA